MAKNFYYKWKPNLEYVVIAKLSIAFFCFFVLIFHYMGNVFLLLTC